MNTLVVLYQIIIWRERERNIYIYIYIIRAECEIAQFPTILIPLHFFRAACSNPPIWIGAGNPEIDC